MPAAAFEVQQHNNVQPRLHRLLVVNQPLLLPLPTAGVDPPPHHQPSTTTTATRTTTNDKRWTILGGSHIIHRDEVVLKIRSDPHRTESALSLVLPFIRVLVPIFVLAWIELDWTGLALRAAISLNPPPPSHNRTAAVLTDGRPGDPVIATQRSPAIHQGETKNITPFLHRSPLQTHISLAWTTPLDHCPALPK